MKTYQLPTSKDKDGEGSNRPGPRKLSTWTGLATGLVGGRKTSVPEDTEAGAGPATEAPSTVRQGLARMGTWTWGGKPGDSSEKKEVDQDDDDARIRFTIGGAGRRLTKDDFLREIRGLDPKARAEAVESSNASPALKAAARKAGKETGSHASRGLYPAKPKGTVRPDVPEVEETEEDSDSEIDQGRPGASKNVLQLSRRKDAPLATSSAGRIGRVASYEDDEPETAAERKRREGALKGVVDDEDRGPQSSASSDRGRSSSSRSGEQDRDHQGGYYAETAAERRRREAALGMGGPSQGSEEDKNDAVKPFEEPTVPEPAVQPLRGIRFAEAPVKARQDSAKKEKK